MKKITIQNAFTLLAFIFIGSTAFTQIQPAGTWSGIGDVDITKVITDGDNGDGAADGALFIDGTTATIGQGALFTFDGTMQEGKTYAINSNMFNTNGSFVRVRVTLHNKTDDTELAVDVDAGTSMNNGDVHTINFSYTAVSTDAGDVLELRYTRNDDGNTARNFNIDNATLNGNTIGARTIVYSEDFRFASTARGFEAKVVSNGGHSIPGNILKRVSDLPDLADSNNLFDPTIDREANRIPNGGARDQKTISTAGNDGAANYAVDAYAVFTTLDLTSANALINPSDDYVYASFWTEQRSGTDIATITIEVSTDYNGTIAGSTWTTLPLHSGKFGSSADNLKFVKGMVDLSAYTSSTTVTLALRYLGKGEGTNPYANGHRNGTFYISDLQFITQETPIKNVWDGSTDNSLTEPANWDTKAAPATTTNNLVIPAGLTNYPTATSALTVNSLTLESGASFITNSTVTGNVTYKRNLSFTAGNTKGWHLVGAPVTGQAYNNAYVTANSIASGTGNNRGIATYSNGTPNPTTGPWTYLQAGGSGTFATATGYSIKTSATKDISFTGTMNTSNVNDVTISSKSGSGGTDFNLISNPFTSYVNAKLFLEEAVNTALLDSETIWIWNPTSENYEAKMSGDASTFQIAPGQGFFVKAKAGASGDGDLSFKTTAQSHQTTDTFLKTAANPEVQLNITDATLHRYAKVYYNEKATKGFDNGYDGETFNGVANAFDVFTQLLENNQGKNYQIQSLPNQDLEDMVIPVGIKAESGKEITFTANALNLPADIKVFLEDRNSNTFTRLDDANSEYKVTLTETLNGIGRFYLHTKSSVLNTNDVALDKLSIYKSNHNTLRIIGLKQGNANLKLFNILGKQVMNINFKSTEIKDITLPKVSSGIYIIQLTTVAGKLNKKIILE